MVPCNPNQTATTIPPCENGGRGGGTDNGLRCHCGRRKWGVKPLAELTHRLPLRGGGAKNCLVVIACVQYVHRDTGGKGEGESVYRDGENVVFTCHVAVQIKKQTT